MKLVFAGTPEFAARSLSALHEDGHEIGLVLTQPDRASGRGLKARPAAVKKLAAELGLPVIQPESLKLAGVRDKIRSLQPDALIVAAYGLIVPAALLSIARYGAINIHASLLPRWRGAAPIQRALLAGDAETGISIMQMDEGLDTGPVLMRAAIPIARTETAKTLHDKLAALGAELIIRTLAEHPSAEPQDDARATYAAKIDKSEAQIVWTDPASVIERKIRAFDPAPGASTSYAGEPLKVFRAAVVENTSGAPGEVCGVDHEGVTVACGCGTALKLEEMQRAGGRRMPAAAFLAGHAFAVGERLGV